MDMTKLMVPPALSPQTANLVASPFMLSASQHHASRNIHAYDILHNILCKVQLYVGLATQAADYNGSHMQ